MMTPVRMSLAEIVCTKRTAREVIGSLYAAGAVEIEKSERVQDGGIRSFSFPEEEIREAGELRGLFSAFADETPVSSTAVSVLRAPAYARTLREDAERAIAVRRRVDSLKEILRAGETRARCISWLASLGIERESCTSSPRLHVICGTASPGLDCEGELCIRSGMKNGESFLLAAFPPEREAEAERLLRHEDFRAIDILAKTPPDTAQLLADETRTLEGLSSTITDIREADAALSEYLRLAQLFSKSGETQRCAHILCWLPADGEEKIRAALESDSCSLSILPAEKVIEESVFTDEEVPSILSPSRIFAPFRLILSVYGHPAYRSIDPTVPGALFFLLFFGLMFADTGHGAVLAALGLLMRAVRSAAVRDAGKLLIAAGTSSAICGLLFGSFFGLEDVIPALLFHPAQHISPFLFTGLAAGIIVISTGIALNIAKSFIRREWAGAFFSQWGIMTLGFYWLCAGIVAASFSGLRIPPSYVVAAAVIPLAAMTLGEIIHAKLTHGGEFSEIIFHPVEVVLGLLSNTVSFVRLAAFGLCHISLMSAVYIIASSGTGDPVYRISVSIEGNILVIGLELLVVTIQCLRLQFYEFFSKFFGVPGREFAPLRTPHAREGA